MESIKTGRNMPKWVYVASLAFVVVIWGISPVITTKIYHWFSPTVFTIMTVFIAALLLRS